MIDWEIGIKEILELVIVILSLVLYYFSQKIYIFALTKKNSLSNFYKNLSKAFLFFFIASVCELLDSFFDGIIGDIFDFGFIFFQIISYYILYKSFSKLYYVRLLK